MPLIRDGGLARDLWVHRGDDEPLADDPTIISLDRWKRDRATLLTRNAPLGLRLKSDQAPGQVAPDLNHFGVVALEFPHFKDGRPFSYAKLLRDRYQYKGEVRAFGHILRDQYLFLDRLGVNAIEVKDDRALKEWKAAMAEFSVFYQTSVDARRPAMALRRQLAKALKPSRPDFEDLMPTSDVPPPKDAPPPPSNARIAVADAKVRAFSHKYGHLSAQKLMAAMIEAEFEDRIALVSSFGTEAAVLLHMMSEIDRKLPVLFLDTQKLFGETLRYRDQLIGRLGLANVQTIKPDAERVQALDPSGMLFSCRANLCCQIRKVEPLERALQPYDAWITGRKRFQGRRRAVLPIIESAGGRVKINPLAGWSKDLLDEYFTEHGLPHHPLEAEGFLSIGCMPCTDRVAPGEDMRAGRWRGQDKDECGIHETPAAQSLTSSGL
jgi:phosphoadenosine phosphosulfate reductase